MTDPLNDILLELQTYATANAPFQPDELRTHADYVAAKVGEARALVEKWRKRAKRFRSAYLESKAEEVRRILKGTIDQQRLTTAEQQAEGLAKTLLLNASGTKKEDDWYSLLKGQGFATKEALNYLLSRELIEVDGQRWRERKEGGE